MSDDLEPFRAALEDAVDIADRLQVRAMLIGALARELCLPEAVRKSSRKTRDADLALLLEDWAALAGFFAACETHFELRRSDLYMRHRATGAKVDLVPCGDLEKPPGTVRIPRSRRELTTHGLREAFDRATALAFGSRTLRVPSPAAFVLLKCFSFLDRRAPHDLRDAGSVLQRLPFEEDAIWNDAGAMDAFAQGSLEWENTNAWVFGRTVSQSFSEATRLAFVRAVDLLQAEAPPIRRLITGEVGASDELVDRADRQLAIVRLALVAGPPTP